VPKEHVCSGECCNLLWFFIDKDASTNSLSSLPRSAYCRFKHEPRTQLGTGAGPATA
jgi:hypothetical protein